GCICILIGPLAAQEWPYRTPSSRTYAVSQKKGNTELNNITEITPEVVTGLVCQVTFTLSDAGSWKDRIRDIDLIELYTNTVQMLSMDLKWVNETLDTLQRVEPTKSQIRGTSIKTTCSVQIPDADEGSVPHLKRIRRRPPTPPVEEDDLGIDNVITLILYPSLLAQYTRFHFKQTIENRTNQVSLSRRWPPTSEGEGEQRSTGIYRIWLNYQILEIGAKS
ncbi:hypothetical protein BDM02DRAFT_3133535, partial [Thelephora ganbajun]